MAGSQTFTIVKPTALRNGCLGKIICMIQDQGFKIKALKIGGENCYQTCGISYWSFEQSMLLKNSLEK